MLTGLLNLLHSFFSHPALLIVLFVIFILLNILDGHSTWMVIKPNHFRRERNPVARWIFRKLGIPRGIVIFKVVLLAILAVAFAIYARHETFLPSVILLVANLVFLLVVIHNYRIHRRIRQPKLPDPEEKS
ncbi:MAG: hypothetical protein K0B87_03680 [Candidatus Syntrophosphaera sp.]|nr:hypothetical protein [Candidatus Syntrophosphaera sp.]